ncbi:glycosyltransferase [Blautia sp. Sow4_E7]|jgi:GT2 family glycosyltransferase|uniref:glycosyltransferase n=1 Tax=Blautia sp. Sow4_E7 TaxID=3438749 RepID=UPI003F915186
MEAKLNACKVGFIILHYNDIETTKKCIDSIQCLEQIQDSKILIVDNHSPNNSGAELKKQYAGIENIEILLLEDNYGYSRANNIGYAYLKKSENFDYIVVANNDIIFEQRNLISILEEKYREAGFYVAGPNVYAIYKKQHQNPLALRPRSLEETEAWIEENRRCLKNMKREYLLHCIWQKVNRTKIYSIYRKRMDSKIQKTEDDKWKHSMENIVLSGSCLFFSERFIKNNEKLFEPETYFYHEEDILTTKCLKNGWKTLYIPDIAVQHLEGASTNTKNYDQKMKFRYTNFIKAAEIYAEYLKHVNSH